MREDWRFPAGQFGGHEKKSGAKTEACDGGREFGALVLFGVTGDLAHKMIFPALYAMAKRGTSRFRSLGCALEVDSAAPAQTRN